MHHEDRESGMGDDVPGYASDQAFAQAAPAIAANHEQIGISFRSCGQ